MNANRRVYFSEIAIRIVERALFFAPIQLYANAELKGRRNLVDDNVDLSVALRFELKRSLQQV